MSEKNKGSREMSWNAVLTGGPGGNGAEAGMELPLKKFLDALKGQDGKLDLDDPDVLRKIRQRAYTVAEKTEEAQLANQADAEKLKNEATTLAHLLPEFRREDIIVDEHSREFRLADMAGLLGGTSEETRRVDLEDLAEATGDNTEEDLDTWQTEVSERLDATVLEDGEKPVEEDSESASQNYLLNVGPERSGTAKEEEGRPVSDSMIEESRKVREEDETRKTIIHGEKPQADAKPKARGLGTGERQGLGLKGTMVRKTPEEEFFGEPLENPAETFQLEEGKSRALAGMGKGKAPEDGRTDTILEKRDLGDIIREGLAEGIRITQTGEKPLSEDTIRRMEEDSGRRLTRDELGETVLQEPGDETADLGRTEDFRPYGDIFYAMKKVFRESGEREAIGFEESLEKAIELAEGIAAETDSVSEEDATAMSSELRRVNRLRRFKREFVDIQKDKKEPKKSLNQYKLWLTREKSRYEEILKINWERGEKKIPDAFRILGMSPGEYSRKATLRVCEAFLNGKDLDTREEEKVGKLKELLETRENSIEEERNAELAYEMLVGKATEYQRELSEKRETKIDEMDEKLGKMNISLAEFEGKKKEIINVLKLVYLANRSTEKRYKAINQPEVKEALMELESDYRERKKWMGLIVNILSRDDDGFRELWEKAKAGADKEIFPENKLIKQKETGESKKPGPVASGIGNAIKMAAGAGILAAGMWLNQQGIINLGNQENVVEKEQAAEVEVAEMQETPPGKTLETKRVEKEPREEPSEPAEKAEKEQPEKIIKETGEKAEEIVEGAEEVEVKPLTKAERMELLWEQLDEYCQEEHGLLVNGEMLRKAYRSIESQLDGSVMPDEKKWAEHMLKVKFPNSYYELAVLSDLWRSAKSLEAPVAYAVGMKMAIVMGHAAGRPKFWGNLSKMVNKGEIALEKDSFLGTMQKKIKTVQMKRCTAASFENDIERRMKEIKEEALEKGMTENEFESGVKKAFGRKTWRVMKKYEKKRGEAQHERRKDICRTVHPDSTGRNAIRRAIKNLKTWKIKRRLKKQNGEESEEAKYQRGNDRKGPKASEVCRGLDGMEYVRCAHREGKKDRGEKKFHAPKKKESGGKTSGPRMRARF
ncbi:MAG: hypothetical protein ACLFUZ_04305 [Candidatus Micrarchaeia archaeon]